MSLLIAINHETGISERRREAQKGFDKFGLSVMGFDKLTLTRKADGGSLLTKK